MMSPFAHIYLSPHLDDAALSCGGRIWEQTAAGERVLVATIFAASPPPDAPLSPFAQKLNADWTGDPAARIDAMHMRRAEDLAAVRVLGAEAAHWPYTDCIYRRTPDGAFPYGDVAALFGEVHPDEEPLAAELAARMQGLPLAADGVLYTPMGIGHHVDHQLVRRAAESSGLPLLYYEDYPYAENEAAVQAALATGAWRAEWFPISERALEAKAAAILCYPSQIGAFWASATEMRAALRRFAGRAGDGALAERYWRPA